jgi:hypothetical protein
MGAYVAGTSWCGTATVKAAGQPIADQRKPHHVESGQYGYEVDPVPCQYDLGFADTLHQYQP